MENQPRDPVAVQAPEDLRVTSRPTWVGWRMKAVLPVALVLLGGILAFTWVTTFSFEGLHRELVLLVASVGAVVICGVLLAALSVVLREPLVELQQKIERVQAGDLTAQVHFSSRNDEIGELGRQFNAMVHQLRESREEIERLHRTQFTRAEHLATLGELAAGLAHEIRNPLAGIAGVIEIIGRDLPEGSPSRAVLKDVQQEVLHIKQILSDLLDYARPRAPHIRPADLAATAEHAVALARQQAVSKSVRIELKKPAILPLVEHDSAQIQQVMVNLLLNSIQAIDASAAAAAAGEIQVRLEPRGSFVAVTVRDNGRGIAPEHLGNIFRPFFTTKGQGTGLGLSLAHRIVEDHGGRISVTSQPGKGTEIVIELPLRPLATAPSGSGPG
jgi:two-component system NtrC family sensor kinase